MTVIPTFAEFRATMPRLGAANESAEVDIVWSLYDQSVSDRIEQIKSDPDLPGSESTLVDVLARCVIEDHLGADWYQRNITDSASSGQARNYLDSRGHRLYRLLSKFRTHELARRLYELQSFEWFEHILRKVRTSNLSGPCFELDVLSALHVASGPIVARAETGTKGEDFDLVTHIKGRLRPVPIEVKAKDDSTEFTTASVIGTVKAAARRRTERVASCSYGFHMPGSVPRCSRQYGRETTLLRCREAIRKCIKALPLVCPPRLPALDLGICLMFKHLWDSDMTQLAAHAPF